MKLPSANNDGLEPDIAQILSVVELLDEGQDFFTPASGGRAIRDNKRSLFIFRKMAGGRFFCLR
jgi:hypothetical protein